MRRLGAADSRTPMSGAAATTCSRLSSTSSASAVDRRSATDAVERLAGLLRHAQGLGDRRHDQARIADRIERDEPDTVRKVFGGVARRFNRKTGLAGSARPGQGDQPLAFEQPGQVGQLAPSAHEASHRRGQVGGRYQTGSSQRRKI